jgi:hypothetical protein
MDLANLLACEILAIYSESLDAGVTFPTHIITPPRNLSPKEFHSLSQETH